MSPLHTQPSRRATCKCLQTLIRAHNRSGTAWLVLGWHYSPLSPGIILVSDRQHLSPKRTKDVPCLPHSGGAPLPHYTAKSLTQGGLSVSLLLNFFIKKKKDCHGPAFNQLWSGKIFAPVAVWVLVWIYGIHKYMWPKLTRFFATCEVPRCTFGDMFKRSINPLWSYSSLPSMLLNWGKNSLHCVWMTGSHCDFFSHAL